jgi:hypothetical protein
VVRAYCQALDWSRSASPIIFSKLRLKRQTMIDEAPIFLPLPPSSAASERAQSRPRSCVLIGRFWDQQHFQPERRAVKHQAALGQAFLLIRTHVGPGEARATNGGTRQRPQHQLGMAALPEERQDVATLQLATDDYPATSVNAVNWKLIWLCRDLKANARQTSSSRPNNQHSNI